MVIKQELYKKITGSKLSTVQDQAVVDTMKLAPPGNSVDDTHRWSLMHLAELKPKGAQDLMLCEQMIALHRMAIACSSRALSLEQTFEGREMNMRHATKLMNAFANLSTVRDKHRGKGKQKITVEHQHVQVEAGGQAIIGDVHHGGGENDKKG